MFSLPDLRTALSRYASGERSGTTRDNLAQSRYGEWWVRVVPKIAPAHFMYLVRHSDVVPRLAESQIEVAEGADFVDLVARWCVGAAEQLLKLGVPNMATEEVDPTEQVNTVVRLMRLMDTRMSWDMRSQIYRRAGIHVCRGPDETIENFVSAPVRPGKLNKLIADLVEAVDVHTCVGRKLVTWYDMRQMRPRDASALKTWANSVDPIDASEGRKVGFEGISTKQKDLEPLLGQPPTLCDSVRRDGQLFLRYFSVRSFSQREEIRLSALSVEQRAPLQEFSQVIGVKSICLPCFDVVVFDPAKDRIEVRVDNLSNIRSDDQHYAMSRLLEEANNVVFKHLTIRPLGLGLVDFFPAVDRLYRNKRAGSVTMLGFVAISDATSSNNRGQPFRRRGADLRKDNFHIGGRGNVQKIRPYSIEVSWPRSPDPLTLALNGTVRMLYKVPNISEAEFGGCSSLSDYEFLAEELSKRLTA